MNTRHTIAAAAMLLAVLSAPAVLAEDAVREWEDQSVNYVNTEPMRPDCAVPAGPVDLMLLNGDWKFHFSLTPETRPADFFRPDYDVSLWNTIKVPSTWEIQGYGTPLYSGWEYPFKVDPPFVTKEPAREKTSFV